MATMREGWDFACPLGQEGETRRASRSLHGAYATDNIIMIMIMIIMIIMILMIMMIIMIMVIMISQ